MCSDVSVWAFKMYDHRTHLEGWLHKTHLERLGQWLHRNDPRGRRVIAWSITVGSNETSTRAAS
jgi:hypothetical protein